MGRTEPPMNGRRAWRRFAKQQRRKVNRRNRQTGTPWINDADGAFYRHEQKHFEQRPIVPVGPFTAHSLVGMSEAAKKRAVRAELEPKWWFGIKHGVSAHAVGEYARDVETVRTKYRISERLRPCPGCCACWGHRISSAYGEIAECCGPQTSGKRKSQIKAMRKWQETLADDCDGSGVLPAKSTKAKRPE